MIQLPKGKERKQLGGSIVKGFVVRIEVTKRMWVDYIECSLLLSDPLLLVFLVAVIAQYVVLEQV